MTKDEFDNLKIGDYILLFGFTRYVDLKYNGRIGKIIEDHREDRDEYVTLKFDNYNYGKSKTILKCLMSVGFGMSVANDSGSDLPHMKLFTRTENSSEYED